MNSTRPQPFLCGRRERAHRAGRFHFLTGTDQVPLSDFITDRDFDREPTAAELRASLGLREERPAAE